MPIYMKSLILGAALVLCCEATAAAQNQPGNKGPLVRISGTGDVTVSGGAVAVHGVGVASASASKHDQTIEMAQQLLKHCPEATLTVAEDAKPNYELFLNRESLGDSQIMLLRASDKTVLWATSQDSVARAAKKACKAIFADWKDHRPTTAGAWWNADKPKPE
jgi:hypothetical protein